MSELPPPSPADAHCNTLRSLATLSPSRPSTTASITGHTQPCGRTQRRVRPRAGAHRRTSGVCAGARRAGVAGTPPAGGYLAPPRQCKSDLARFYDVADAQGIVGVRSSASSWTSRVRARGCWAWLALGGGAGSRTRPYRLPAHAGAPPRRTRHTDTLCAHASCPDPLDLPPRHPQAKCPRAVRCGRCRRRASSASCSAPARCGASLPAAAAAAAERPMRR